MEPASIRYKNPGAMWGRTGPRPAGGRTVPTNAPTPLKYGSKETVYLSDGTGQGNNIAVFPTYVQGICAQIALWRDNPKYKNKTVAAALDTWSGGNHVEEYIAFVRKRVPGLTRDTVLNYAFWKSPEGIAFLKAQAWHEAGKKYPAPDADFEEAQRIMFTTTLTKLTTLAVENKGKIIATARTTGLTGGAGTLVAAGVNQAAGPSGTTVEKAEPIINTAGEVVGQVKTVVDWVPPDWFNYILSIMQTRGFAWCIIGGMTVAWFTSYIMRRNEGPH